MPIVVSLDQPNDLIQTRQHEGFVGFRAGHSPVLEKQPEPEVNKAGLGQLNVYLTQ